MAQKENVSETENLLGPEVAVGQAAMMGVNHSFISMDVHHFPTNHLPALPSLQPLIQSSADQSTLKGADDRRACGSGA